jgi:nucleoside-diphosphate-sugar epimerase
MSTLVTGGLGYVGRYIVKELAQRGQEVVSFNRDYAELKFEHVTAVQGELYDIPRIVDTIKRHSVDRIIHTAAMSHPDLSIELPITTVTANVEGTVHLFEAAKMAGVARIVNFSSEVVYGHIDGIVKEDARLTPTTPYAVTKVATEHFGRVYNELYRMQIISLRVGEIYGPGNRMPQILRDIIKVALQGDRFAMPTGGDHRFHFIHVEDVARAAIQAAAAPPDRSYVFNIAGGGQWALHEAVTLIRKFIPHARIDIGGGYWHLDRQGPWDISSAERELGYHPSRAFEDGIRDYVEWLRHNEY